MARTSYWKLITIFLFFYSAVAGSYVYAQPEKVRLAEEYYQIGEKLRALTILESYLKTNPSQSDAIKLVTKILHDLIEDDIKSRNSVEGEYYLAKLKKYNPSDPEIDYYSGIFNFLDGEYGEAIKKLKNFLDKPDFPLSEKFYYRALLLHSEDLLSTDKFPEAEPYLKEYLDKFPESDKANFLMGKLLFLEKKYSEAIQYLSRIKRDSQFYIDSLFILGECKFNMGDFVTGLKEMIKSYKSFTTARKGKILYTSFKKYALHLYEAGNYDNLIKLCQKWLTVFSKALDPVFYMGKGYYMMGKYELAEKMFLKVLKSNPNYPETGKWLGKTYLMLGLIEKKKKNYSKALSLFEKAYFYDVHQGEAYFHAGEIYFWLKKYEKAEPLLKLALREKAEELKSLYYLGKIAFDQKKFKKAIGFLEKLTSKYGKYKNSYFLLSRSYYNLAQQNFKSGKILSAQIFALESYKFDKNFLPCWYLIGETFFLQKNYEKAVSWFEKVFGKNRNYEKIIYYLSEGYFFIGKKHFDTADYTSAIAYFKKSLNITPDKLKSRYFLGLSLYYSGKYAAAVKELGKVYRKDKSFKKVTWWYAETYYRWGEELFNHKKFSDALKLLLKATEIYPEKKEAWYLAGKIKYLTGDYFGADKYFTEAFKLDPDYRDLKTLYRNTLVILGRYFFKKGKYENAFSYFTRVIEFLPEDGEANYYAGKINFFWKKYEKAYSNFQIASSKNFNYLDSEYMLGKISVIMSRWDDAILHLRNVISINTSYRDTRKLIEKSFYMAGKESFGRGEYERAIEYLKNAYSFNPNRLDTSYLLGVSYYNLKNYFLAQKFLYEVRNKNGKKSYRDSDSYLGDSLIKLAESSYEKKQYEEGIEWAQKALKINPGDKRGYYLLGEIYLDQKKFDTAITFLKKTEKLDPQYRDLKQKLYLALKGKGESLESAGETESAITFYLRALKYNPGDQNLYIRIAELYSTLGKTEEGIKILDKLLSFAPDNNEALYLKGKYLFSLKKFSDAIIPLSKLYKLTPNYKDVKKLLFESYLASGKVLLRSDDLKRAESNFKRAVDLYPDNGEALYYLAFTLYREKKFDEALDYWRKAYSVKAPFDNLVSLYSENLRKIVQNRWKGKYSEKLKHLLEERKKLTDDNWNRLFLGYIYFLHGNYSDAIKEVGKINDLSFSTSEIPYSAGVLLGKSHFKRGLEERKESLWRKALNDFLKANSLISDDELFFFIGESLYHLGNYHKSYEWLQKYISAKGKNPEAWFLAGMILEKGKKFEKAVAFYREFISHGGKKEKVLDRIHNLALLICRTYEKKKEYSKAISWLRTGLEINYSPRDEVHLGKLYYKIGNYEKALSILERDKPYLDSEAKEILKEIYLDKGKKFLEKEEYARARIYLEKAFFYGQGEPEIAGPLITARYNLGDYEGVVSLFSSELIKKLNNEERDLMFQSLLMVAIKEINSSPERSLKLIERAKEIKTTPALKFYQGLALYRLKRYPEALEVLSDIEEEGVYLDKALNLIKKVKYDYGKKLVKEGKECEKGLELLLSIYDDFHSNRNYRYFLARGYFCTGNYEKAYRIAWDLYREKKDVKTYKLLLKIKRNLR